MNLEKLAREAIGSGGNGLSFTDLAADKNTGKVTGILHTDGGRAAHVRIEGNTVVLQSWDDGEGDDKPEAPHVSEAKAKQAEKDAERAAAKGKK